MSVLLLSGGMDSTLCLHLNRPKLAIGVHYGQPHAIELDYAAASSARYGVPFKVLNTPSMARTTDFEFAGRNAVLLATAVSVAHLRGYGEVVIGCNKTDAETFADCAPRFLEKMSDAFMEAYGICVVTPLINKSKSEVVEMCRELGITGTWTCYSPDDRGEPCNTCLACLTAAGGTK